MLKHLQNKREILSWCFFDFANSSFTTIIITIVFSVYFVKIIALGSSEADGLWALGNFLSQLIVLLTAPLFGAIADFSAKKKRFLFLSYSLCILFTAALAIPGPGQVALALAIFIVANFAYSSGENFIASFLPEIARPEDMGKISGFGWALGYVGGLISLLICLPFLKGGFVMENADALRYTNIVVAVFFLLAGIPTFLWVKERKTATALPSGSSYVTIGLQRIRDTFQHIRMFRELFRFLIIFGIYNCGVTTVVVFSSIYAVKTVGLTPNELIVFFLITQVSASLGAFLFGLIQDRLGAKNTIYITLSLWIGVIFGAYFSSSRNMFFIVGNLAGLGLGSSQSAARALVGLFSPVEKSGEFFGFWGLFWKLSTAVGPLVFGLLSSGTGSQRLAILVTGLFFIFGMIGLFFVNEKKGI
ncbi:MAG TPA: MFS transporter, partial [Acidobacteriota bacterium]